MTQIQELPALICGFNRPDLTGELINRLEIANVKRVYFSVDGPRNGSSHDLEMVERVIELVRVKSRNFDSEIRIRETNYGCRAAMIDALTWFFGREEAGCVLEADCIPHPDFFSFCQWGLARYQGDARIWSISGSNLISCRSDQNSHPYLSRFGGTWGWATWRDKWEKYETVPGLGEDWRDVVRAYYSSRSVQRWYANYVKISQDPDSTIWSMGFDYPRIKNGSFTLSPPKNLVQNKGFDGNGVHASHDSFQAFCNPTEALSVDLASIPFEQVRENKDLDKKTFFIIQKADPNAHLSHSITQFYYREKRRLKKKIEGSSSRTVRMLWVLLSKTFRRFPR